MQNQERQLPTVGNRVYFDDQKNPTQSGWYLLHRVRNVSGSIDSPDALVTLCRENNEPGDYISALASEISLTGPQTAPVELAEAWPHGATVRLRYNFSGDIGWAKRDAEGRLVSAYSQLPLDHSQWFVLEERQQESTASSEQGSFQFIKQVFTENTGGGCMVDFIELKTGQVIGLNDECVVLYPSMVAYREGAVEDFDGFRMFYRPEASTIIDKPRLGAYTDAIVAEATVDLVVLETGEVLGIDGGSVCLYASMDAAFSGAPDSVIATIELNAEVPQAGQWFQSTDPGFEGTVMVTKVSDSLVHYEGDADGYTSIAQFFKQYRPVAMTAEETTASADPNSSIKPTVSGCSSEANVAEPEIRKVLVLSTNHLTKHTCLEYKSWPFLADFEEGCYFHVGDEPESYSEAPEELRHVLTFAKQYGCTEVKFDRDADVLDHLPRFEW